MQCNVDGCKSLVTLKGLMDHFKSHDLPSVSFKCDVCDLGFKDKKALEIHRTNEHIVLGMMTKHLKTTRVIYGAI